MAKLRKMLGNIQSQECMEMKGLIETQCHHTLSAWAVAFAKESYLPIYAAECGSSCLEDAVAACEAYLAGARMLKDVKPYLRAAAQLARETGESPVAQAAARAVAVACAVVQTPTNSLGFLFYGAAAKAYQKAGLAERTEVYDDLAEQEWRRAIASFREILIPEEPDPVKIKWGC